MHAQRIFFPFSFDNNLTNHLALQDKVRPVWEDKANLEGGRWIVNIRGDAQENWLKIVCFD
jgi:hypothetical protein